MKKFYPPLLLTAALSVFCVNDMSAYQVQVGLYTMESSNQYSAQKDTKPKDLLGTWTTDKNALRYDAAKDRYYFDNFLGCEGATLEFAVSKDVSGSYDVSEEWVNWPRYDFNIYYQTKSDKTTGLKYADLCEGMIRPYNSFVALFTIAAPYDKELAVIPAKFVNAETSDFYQLNAGWPSGTAAAGLRIYASAPQAMTHYETKPGMTGIGGQTANSYVTKNGDDYTVYLHFNYTGNQSYSVNEFNEAQEDAIYDKKQLINGYYLVFTFNKDLKEKPTAIESVGADSENVNAPVEYFNLQGMRVENPAAGLYIRRQGNKVEKVYVK